MLETNTLRGNRASKDEDYDLHQKIKSLSIDEKINLLIPLCGNFSLSAGQYRAPKCPRCEKSHTTPSFSVSREQQVYFCFYSGCNKGGKLDSLLYEFAEEVL